jgi:hypothetical protein
MAGFLSLLKKPTIQNYRRRTAALNSNHLARHSSLASREGFMISGRFLINDPTSPSAHESEAGSERILRIDRLVHTCNKDAESLCFFLGGAHE